MDFEKEINELKDMLELIKLYLKNTDDILERQNTQINILAKSIGFTIPEKNN
jgi:hypothetical protein